MYNLGTDRIENTSPNTSSNVVSHEYRLDRVKNTISVLLFTSVT
jgi:hypothetical protein